MVDDGYVKWFCHWFQHYEDGTFLTRQTKGPVHARLRFPGREDRDEPPGGQGGFSQGGPNQPAGLHRPSVSSRGATSMHGSFGGFDGGRHHPLGNGVSCNLGIPCSSARESGADPDVQLAASYMAEPAILLVKSSMGGGGTSDNSAAAAQASV